VHHSDGSLNATSALRFHPLDVVLSQGLFPCLWIPVIGMSMASFILYGTAAILLLIPQHSNIKFPDWFETYGRFVFSTPGWHKIHHADEARLTNSHYGDVFTFWDRLFGTWHRVEPTEICYGLKEFASPDRQRAGFLLKSPFVDVKQEQSMRT
jgi:sterol desaturase/sphingolipid hydroxylase (fatty acid hydroxylase superfamily)